MLNLVRIFTAILIVWLGFNADKLIFGDNCWKLRVIRYDIDFVIQYKNRERMPWRSMVFPKISSFSNPRFDDSEALFLENFDKCVNMAQKIKSYKQYETMYNEQLVLFKKQHQERIDRWKGKNQKTWYSETN